MNWKLFPPLFSGGFCEELLLFLYNLPLNKIGSRGAYLLCTQKSMYNYCGFFFGIIEFPTLEMTLVQCGFELCRSSENQLCISGPEQFKPVFFKCQL